MDTDAGETQSGAFGNSSRSRNDGSTARTRVAKRLTTTKRRRSQPDRLDLRILNALHREGRISKTKLSSTVGLSATRCWERMRRMEDEGIIRGYHADVCLRRLAKLSLFLVQIKLKDATASGRRRFERLVAEADEILSCDDVLGSFDYFLIVAASSVEAFGAFMEQFAVQEGARFEHTTFPIAKSVKATFGVSLSALLTRVSSHARD